MSAEPVSNARVDRAGALLREMRKGPLKTQRPADLDQAREVVERFRARFLDPHLAVAARLRELVADIDPAVTVTARLKRYERIVDKLVRHPHMRLSQMQDVGGCRAVLASRIDRDRGPLAVVAQIAEVIRADWEIVAEDDYITAPRQSGYRALHLVAGEAGAPVEIQLRTFRQDGWAELVESMARDAGLRLADGEGPRDVVRLFQAASEIYAANDRGEDAPAHLVAEFERLLPALTTILGGRES
jgi:putative GTP pyrophosphokinase